MRLFVVPLLAWFFVAHPVTAKEDPADLAMDYAAGLLEGCVEGLLDGQRRLPMQVAKSEDQCVCQLPLNRKLTVFRTDTAQNLRGVFETCKRLTAYARATIEERGRLGLVRKGLEEKYEECHDALYPQLKALDKLSVAVVARAARLSCLCHATAKALLALEEAGAPGGVVRYSQTAATSDEMCIQLTQGALGRGESPFARVLNPLRKRD